MIRALAVLAAVSLVACSAPVKCDSTSCASGCCDSTGQCQSASPLTCGNFGAACVACTTGSSCQLGACSATGGGGGGGTGGGSGGGGGGDAGDTDAGNLDGGPRDGGLMDGGTDAGVSGFMVTSLDSAAREATYFAMAVDPVQERVGVAYFSPGVGATDYDLKYVEWRQGVVSPIQTVRVVQRRVGLSMVFDRATGEPILSYLGGAAGFVVGMSVYWFQSDAVINRRSGGSTWTESAVAATGDQVTCGNPVSDRGFLVGLWPSLAVGADNKLYLAYRDGHDGQFPLQDWGGSDVELWEGLSTPGTGSCVAQGGVNKDAWGGHNQLRVCGTELALVHDQMFGTADTNGINVIFQKRTAAGTWSSPGALLSVSNTQTGPVLACDSVEGFGVGVVDRATNELVYTHSLNGTAWSATEPVFGVGSGGWYPSLAMDPVRHEPAFAFYNCSPQGGSNELGCLTTEDELVVSQRKAGTWSQDLVDANGGFAPKLGFFASGKRLVVYRVPPAIDPSTGAVVPNVGALKIAIER